MSAVALAKKVTILDAIHMLHLACQTIYDLPCFRKAFSAPEDGEQELSNSPDISDDVPVPLKMTPDEFKDLVNQDMAVGREEAEENEGRAEDSEDEQQESQPDILVKISPQEYLEALTKVRWYCQQGDFNENIHESLKRIEKECLLESNRAKTVQKYITDFFK